MKRVCWSRTEKISFSKVSIAMRRESHVWNDFVSLSAECELKTWKKHERSKIKVETERCTLSRQQQSQALKLRSGTLLFSSRFLRVAAWQRSQKIAARGMASERELFRKCLLSLQSDRAWLISLRDIHHGNHRATSRLSMLQLNSTEREKFC